MRRRWLWLLAAALLVIAAAWLVHLPEPTGTVDPARGRPCRASCARPSGSGCCRA